jgi:hypothetical protein
MTEVIKLPVTPNSPEAICKLLRAIAGGEIARANHHDTILIGAAEMIEAFERKLKGMPK